jgi:hypothetical protein
MFHGVQHEVLAMVLFIHAAHPVTTPQRTKEEGESKLLTLDL